MNRGILSDTELRTSAGRIYYILALIILLLVAGFTLFPFLFAFTAGLKNSTEIVDPGFNLLPRTPQWENYREAWNRFEMPRLFGNSIFIVSISVIFRLVVSALAAYSLSMLKPFGARVISTGFLFTLMIPGIAYFVPLFVTISDLPIVHWKLTDTYWGLWLPYSIDALAIFILKTFFDQIPRDIVDCARVDGASSLQILMYIVLPLARSILIVLCVLSFVNIWRDFLLPLLVISNPEQQPITVRLIAVASNYGINLQMAASFMALLPPLLLAIFLQRYMKIGLTLGGIKG